MKRETGKAEKWGRLVLLVLVVGISAIAWYAANQNGYVLFGHGTPASSACLVVTPSGSGAETGADWNNAIAGIPSRFKRGKVYYFADGNYGHSLTLSARDSGMQTIELRKAQSYDNCTSTGWNTATMGSAQMVINSSGSGTLVQISSDYWIINGNGNNAGTTEVGCGGVEANPPAAMTNPPPNPAACGIKIDDSTCTSTATSGCDGGSGVMHGGGSNITWESVEWFGQGLNSNGNNNSETYFWFACVGGCSGSPTSLRNVTMSHNYFHNASTTYFTVVNGNWTNGSFDHNYVWGVHDGSVNHGEAIQLQGNNSTDAIHHNIFRDQQTNGDVVGVATGTQSDFTIYNNADFCSSGGTSTSCRHNDGWLGCFQSGNNCVATNWLVYNNTLSYPSNCGAVLQSGSGIVFNNNLYYNCASAGNGGGATITQDYNSYIASSQSAVGAHDVSCSSGCPAPFKLGTSVQLSSENADWNNRVSLGSPYDTLDPYGNAFTTDRGAAQYVP